MKKSKILRKSLPVALAALLLIPCSLAVGCSSSKQGQRPAGQEVMYQRPQNNKGSKVKSNIKVRGTNKKNRHTTRTY